MTPHQYDAQCRCDECSDAVVFNGIASPGSVDVAGYGTHATVSNGLRKLREAAENVVEKYDGWKSSRLKNEPQASQTLAGSTLSSAVEHLRYVLSRGDT